MSVTHTTTHISIQAPGFTCPDCNMPCGEDYATSNPNRRGITQGDEHIDFDLCDRCASRNYTTKQKINRMRVIWNRVKKNPGSYIAG